jgi:uncharacterized membrane protein
VEQLKMDTPWRSICKSFSWRVLAMFITGGIAWGLTRELRFAALIGLADTCTKLGIYYAHERLWDRSGFGRADPAGLQAPRDYHI